MNMICSRVLLQDSAISGRSPRTRQGVVFIVSDDVDCIMQLAPVCEFLDLEVCVIAASNDLETMLKVHRPMAVIADLDGTEQDGFHVMKMIAGFDAELPVLLLTHGDAKMMGAADAIREIWGLTGVTLTTGSPQAAQVISFLFTAGRRTGCMRLVPV